MSRWKDGRQVQALEVLSIYIALMITIGLASAAEQP
jgi:hypothetical protein